MAPISLWDEITLTRGEDGAGITFRCSDPSLPAGGDNLAHRAARLFFESTGITADVSILLEKNIPHGAGLAGGSSDAASVLLGLNRLFETGQTIAQLTVLAAQLGSDVPFFLHEGAAYCRGRGEVVVPTELPSPLRLLLVKPAFGVATPWAYRRWQDSREWPQIRYAPQTFAGQVFANDLERPVFEKHLFLARTKMWLLEQREVGAALMSGSGSTVFAVLREGAEGARLAARAREELDPELWTCACETVAQASQPEVRL